MNFSCKDKGKATRAPVANVSAAPEKITTIVNGLLTFMILPIKSITPNSLVDALLCLRYSPYSDKYNLIPKLLIIDIASGDRIAPPPQAFCLMLKPTSAMYVDGVKLRGFSNSQLSSSWIWIGSSQ